MKKIMSQNETQANLESKIKKAFAVFLIATCASIAGHAGPISDGGGNTLNYKLIQSYQMNVINSKAYKSLQPTLDNLKVKLPNLHKALTTKMRDSAFYLVPKKMKTLAGEYTGLPFVSDQLAINKIKTSEIFIDNEIYSKMPADEQGRVLLHETLESLILFLSGVSDIDSSMSFVRQGTNIISYEHDLNAADLRAKLISPIESDVRYYEGLRILFRTPETIAEVKAQQDEQIAFELKLKNKFNGLLDMVFSKYDAYCSIVGNFGVSEYQLLNEISSSDKNQIMTELAKFDDFFKLSFALGYYNNLDAAHRYGISTKDIQATKEEIPVYLFKNISADSEYRDMRDVLERLIPSSYSSAPMRLSSYQLKQTSFNDESRHLINSILNLHKTCQNLDKIKLESYQK